MRNWIGAIVVALMVLVVGVFPRGADAQTAPTLGGAESFAVLGGSTVTNTDSPTNVFGDLGVNPGTAVTGFFAEDSGPGIVHGTIYTGTDGEALDARAGVTAAYDALDDQQACEDLTDDDLGDLTLFEGVYCFDTSAGMTGSLVLDGQGNPDAVFIIRTGTTLITESGSSVELIGEADACNVFWQVGSSATLGTGTDFAGNILAEESITLNTGATIIGRALAGTGAVTMDNNIVDARSCTAEADTPTPDDATATTTAEATPTGVASPTSTAVTQPIPPATATAIAEATETPVPSTATASPEATETPPATATAPEGTPTPAAATPTAPQGTPTPDGAATPTPETPTPSAPQPPSTGSGSLGGPDGSSQSVGWVVVGAALLLAAGLALAGRSIVTARGTRDQP